MEITIIIIAIILIIIAFFVGRSLASKPININNDKLREEQKELQDLINSEQLELEKVKKNKEIQETEWRHQLNKLDNDISWKWKEYYKIEEDIKRVNKQYEDKLNVIHNTKQLAKEAYDKNMEVYARKILDRETEFQETLQKKKEEINLINQELESLKNTKAAAIEAARKEQIIKENKDAYCLILPREEERDISLLREVQLKVSKPRAVAMCIWNGYYQKLAQIKFPKILGKKNVCGIYKITNQKTEECYIGQSNDIKTRWYNHAKAGLGIDTPQGNKLYAAMQEYGLDDFTFELLEECESKDLDEKEKYFIELYNANTFGYNSTGGNK